MSLRDICKDDYGYPLELTFIDTDTESAADVSAYATSQVFVFQDPSGNKTEVTATFTTDGSDGLVKVTALPEGLIDEAGFWKVRIKVTSGTAVKRSLWRSFKVEP